MSIPLAIFAFSNNAAWVKALQHRYAQLLQMHLQTGHAYDNAYVAGFVNVGSYVWITWKRQQNLLGRK